LIFFQFRITEEFDDLHPVAEGRRNCLQHVSRGDKHDVGQVERHVQIMIGKGEILFRIEDFQ